MKTRTISLIAAIMLTSWGRVAAQSFNTIGSTKPRYKVIQTTATKHEKEMPSADSTSIYKGKEPTAEAVDSTNHIVMSKPLGLTVHSPLASPLKITSPYGIRRHPILKVNKMHNGVDLHAKFEPVYAMLPGVVVKTGYDNISGNFVTLQHASLRVSYCHLSYIGCKKGDSVYAGQPLGIAGSTGRSTGVHLHLTLKIGNQHCNPAPLLRMIEQQTIEN